MNDGTQYARPEFKKVFMPRSTKQLTTNLTFQCVHCGIFSSLFPGMFGLCRNGQCYMAGIHKIVDGCNWIKKCRQWLQLQRHYRLKRAQTLDGVILWALYLYPGSEVLSSCLMRFFWLFYICDWKAGQTAWCTASAAMEKWGNWHFSLWEIVERWGRRCLKVQCWIYWWRSYRILWSFFKLTTE